MSKIIFGIYTTRGEILGYKVDTFWTLDKDKSNGKLHVLDENGDIPAHIIDNLSKIVTKNMGSLECLVGDVAEQVRGKRGLRVGYELENSNTAIHTHYILSDGVRPLSREHRIEVLH